MSSKIIFSNYHIPDFKVDIAVILEKVCDSKMLGNLSLNQFCDSYKAQSGLNNISIGNKKDLFEIYESLLSDMFQNIDIDPLKIGYIIVTEPQNSIIDGISLPHYFQKKFNMFNSTIFTLQQQCAGSLMICGLSNSLIKKNNPYTLILSSCYIDKVEERCMGFSIVGDGAGIMLIGQSQNGCEIVDSDSISDGLYSYNKYNRIEEEINRLSIVEKGCDLVTGVLNRNSLTNNEIVKFIPQNINKYAYERIYSSILELESEKMFKIGR